MKNHIFFKLLPGEHAPYPLTWSVCKEQKNKIVLHTKKKSTLLHFSSKPSIIHESILHNSVIVLFKYIQTFVREIIIGLTNSNEYDIL